MVLQAADIGRSLLDAVIGAGIVKPKTDTASHARPGINCELRMFRAAAHLEKRKDTQEAGQTSLLDPPLEDGEKVSARGSPNLPFRSACQFKAYLVLSILTH